MSETVCTYCGGKGKINKFTRDKSGEGRYRDYPCPSCTKPKPELTFECQCFVCHHYRTTATR